MELRIVTDGFFNRTQVFVNGEEWKVAELKISASVPLRRHGKLTGGAVKMQVQRELDGKMVFLSFYGADFEKFDEAARMEKDSEKGN